MTASREPWYRAPFTDHDENFDGGAMFAALSVAALIALSAYAVVVRGQPFNPAELGMGIGSVLGGWAVYKWGDSRRAPSYQPSARVTTRVDIPDDQ